ncbi:MAG: cytochrome c oxidase accessory protein CcoG [Rhodospirillum sp.]|nr:cytochrome c oxidase accessory protein CcoG [Rhodospirillum sp.]MCF8491150.1 cytochrome c oxidase accessory protein CcoG [Rhodospirillum sp.]
MSVANEAADPGKGKTKMDEGRVAKGVKPVAKTNSMYEQYQKIYPRSVSGLFRNIKWWVMGLLLTVFWVGPWIRWERAGAAPDQAIFIDLPGRKAYFFFIEIWPQEVYYLTGLLIIAAIALFYATALAGRVWCGFACFQTVFTDLFVWVERKIEGERNSRITLDQGKVNANKLGKKILKNGVWLAISLAVGIGFSLYFQPVPWEALAEIFTLKASAATYGAIAVVGGGCYVMAGFAREQVCIYMCPYARFQSAMMDEHSLIVTYEQWRGEPRGKYSKDADFSQRGHCVDCGLCVQVCPTGVDIREGTQIGCIGCGLCVDACATVMKRFNLPTDLITYDSVANQNARAEKKPEPTKLIRPRTILYTVVLVLVCGLMATSLLTRSRLEVNVLHERSPLFVPMSDGSIRNGYTFKILNMERTNNAFVLTTRGVEGATMEVLGVTERPVKEVLLPVEGDRVGSFRIYVSVPRASLHGPTSDLEFVLINKGTGESVDYDTLFAGPH